MRRIPRRHSLRWRLPALILVLLASLGAAFTWAAYLEMRRALEAHGEQRVRHTAQQLSLLLRQSVAARLAETRQLARNPGILPFLQHGEGRDQAVAAVRSFSERNPGAMLSLVSPDGTAVHIADGEVSAGIGAPRDGWGDTGRIEGVSRLLDRGDHLAYRTAATVNDPPDGGGSVIVERPLSSSSGAALIEQLLGSGATLKLGNASGDVWTDLSEPVEPPLAGSTGAEAVHFVDAEGTGRIGLAVPVPDTPWHVWVDFDAGALMEPAGALMRRMLPIVALLVGAGVAAGMIASARITTPLKDLTAVAEAIAARDYSARFSGADRRDEIGRLGATFNTMAQRVAESREALEARVAARTRELEAANRELETFSYSVSHDLRAPLRSIDGFSLALLEDCGPQLGEEGQTHLRRIRGAAQHMGQLIDDLLNLARVARAEMHPVAVDLSEMAESTLAALAKEHASRSVSWKIQPGLRTLGDARLLQIALRNLLENAWKFTSRTPNAVIEFGAVVTDGRPEYFVRDNGAGFDPAYSGKLFGPFQRLHHASDFPGTGIGLATVQRIVARHGGRIRATGAVGQGATFWFTLERDSE